MRRLWPDLVPAPRFEPSCALPVICCGWSRRRDDRMHNSLPRICSCEKQLALYVERQVKPRRADDATRIALVALSWLIDWRRILTIVKPNTLIRWHRKGFRLFWRWKSMPRGRPRLPTNLQWLVAEMEAANQTCGEERIASRQL